MNTQAEQAPVHSEAAGRMVHVGFGLAQFAQDLSITEKEGMSDHHSQDLRNHLLLSQRLVILLPCIKQRFPE